MDNGQFLIILALLYLISSNTEAESNFIKVGFMIAAAVAGVASLFV